MGESNVQVVLVTWPETAWSALSRVAGTTPQSLTESGRREAELIGQALRGLDVQAIYSSDERTGVEAADIVADTCGVKRKTVAELAELDMGLWEGLTSEELARRYPKVFKRWRSEPMSVCPPEGEDPADAVKRLRHGIKTVLDKNHGALAAVVMGPIAMRVMRTSFGDAPDKVEFPLHALPLMCRIERDTKTTPARITESSVIAIDQTLNSAHRK